MALKPRSFWVEQRGRQYRVYWRNAPGAGSPARSYCPLYSRSDAEQFISMAGYLGPEAARQVLAAPDVATRQTLIAAALAARGLNLPPLPSATTTLAAPGSDLSAGAPTSASLEPADPRLAGVTFRELWTRFLERQRHLEEGSAELYKAYGKNHLLPFFGDTDIALIRCTRPLRTADVLPGALFVEDDWLKEMEQKPKLDNAHRERPGTHLTYAFIHKVLTVLGQCFDEALNARPQLLEVNPAKGIRLPKQDRREMHFLNDAAAYAALRTAIHERFRPLLDFLVGTGARYGEAAGLLVRHLHLDADRPYVDIRLSLKWRGKKWKLGRPKTRSSVRRILLPPRLVEVLRPLLAGKTAEQHVFTMIEGGPLHHGNFYQRYWKPAVGSAGPPVSKSTRVHDLRHTHAAWLLSAGVPTVLVAKRLGHSSTSTTENVYGHVTTDADDAAIGVVDGRLPEVLARDEQGATVLKLSAQEQQLPEFDIDDEDDLAA